MRSTTHPAQHIELTNFNPPTGQVLHVTWNAGQLQLNGPCQAHFGMPLSHDGQPPGRGAYAGWRSTSDSVEAYTDPIGLWPLFYVASSTDALVSDSLVDLLRARSMPIEFDDDAFSFFLHFGFLNDEATPVRGVSVLPPGGTLRITKDGVNLDAPGIEMVPAEPMSFDDAVDGFIDRLRTAVQRGMKHGDEVRAMALTGGRDSRLILALLHDMDAAPGTCLTAACRPYEPATDVPIASETCHRLGVEYEVVQWPSPVYPWGRATCYACHFCSDEHTQLGPLFTRLSQLTDVAFDGFAGGNIINLSGLVKHHMAETVEHVGRGEFEHAARFLVRPFKAMETTHHYARKLFGVEPRPLDWLRASVAKSLERYAACASPVTEFYFWSRARREIALAPFGVARQIGRMEVPYVDPDVFRFLRSIPLEHRVSKAISDEAIRRVAPQLGDIPYAVTPTRSTDQGTLAKLAAQANWACDAARMSKVVGLKAMVDGRRLPWRWKLYFGSLAHFVAQMHR